MPDFVHASREGSIAIVTIDHPPVNAINPLVARQIQARVAEAMADPGVAAVVLTGAGRNFIAGYDIKEFVRITSGAADADVDLGGILDRLEMSPKPLVAAIRGAALGGGLETALACHYRVAAPDAQLGQPEVKLGLIPGAGGPQRLPRLVGSQLAAKMCANGDSITGAAAKELGLVDEVADDPLAAAIALAGRASGPRRVRDMCLEPGAFAAPALPEKVLERMAARHAIAAVECAHRLTFEAGLAEEARLFRECLYSDESKALIHVFLGEREVAKVPGIPAVPAPAVKLAAIVGGGTMGVGIAMTYANAGIGVLLKETTGEALDRAMAAIRGNYDASAAKGRISKEEAGRRIARIQPVLDYERFAEAGIVVEAVFEDMDLKRAVLAEIDAAAAPDAILATNTSSLDIDRIASAVRRPERVVGHHFFSPAHVMRLLEIVRGKETAPEVIGASLALARKLGKVGVVVGNCKGFVGNRMFHCYRREAQFLVEEGAGIQDVDAALTEFGMAMGPLSVGDLAGLDIGWRIRQQHRHLEKPGVRKPLMEDRLCEMGRFGQKTGAGWYLYDATRKRTSDPQVEVLAAEVAAAAGIERRQISRDEIRDRCLLALINEGCRILEEGIAARPVDIDIIYVTGYGFPAWRGGPMKYAELSGWRRAYDRVREFESRHGELWTPAARLLELAGA